MSNAEQERAEARKALAEATPGPWRINPYNDDEIIFRQKVICMNYSGHEDARLIANAPTWLRNSLDREEQLIAKLDNVHAWREKAAKEASQLRDKVAEQDKEIQRLQRHLENIERKGYV